MAVFMIKAFQVVVCLVVMILFSIIFTVVMLAEESFGAKVLGMMSLGVAIFAGIMISVILHSPNCRHSSLSLPQLEEMGMVATTEYRATRAIEVEESEDEGLYFLLDIGEGKTLCMAGQDLYGYELGFEDEDVDGNPRVSRFPNSHFQLKQHRENGYWLDIIVLGVMLKPEHIFEHFTPDEFEQDRVLENGQIAIAPSFDEIVANKGRLPYPPTLSASA